MRDTYVVKDATGEVRVRTPHGKLFALVKAQSIVEREESAAPATVMLHPKYGEPVELFRVVRDARTTVTLTLDAVD